MRRAYWRMRVFCPSKPWTRPLGARSRIDAFPTDDATSCGRSGTSTSAGSMSGAISSRRDAALSQREHERSVRKRHRAQQGLRMEPVRDLDLRRQVVRKPERRARRRRHEDSEAARLVAPEHVVVDEIRQLVVDRRDLGLRHAGLLELPRRFGREILELDALGVAAPQRIRRQVDRHARRLAHREQLIELRTCRDVRVKNHRSCRRSIHGNLREEAKPGRAAALRLFVCVYRKRTPESCCT